MRTRSLSTIALTAAVLVTLPTADLGQSCGITPGLESLPSGNVGSHGPLELSTASRLLIGDPFDASVRNGPPGAHGCVAYSFTEGLLPLPQFSAFFRPGLPAIFSVFQLDATGSVDGLLPLNAIDPSYCGATVVMQAVTMDPTSPGGIGVSNALRMRIGDVPYARFAYMLDCASGDIIAYLLDQNGVPVAEHPGSPFPSGGHGAPGGCRSNLNDNNNALVEVDGVLYAAHEGTNDIGALRIEADGSLTPIAGSPFPSGGLHPWALAAHPSGGFLYVGNDQTVLAILAIAPDGSLSEAFPSISTGNGLLNLEMHPSGQVMWSIREPVVVTTIFNAPIGVFGIAADGSVTTLASIPVRRPYAALAVTPSGDHLYALQANSTTQPTVPPSGVFGFDVLLSAMPTFPSIAGSPFVNATEGQLITEDGAVSVDGRFLFVFNEATPTTPEHIRTYAIDATGALASIGTTPTGRWTARTMEVTPDGTRLYTAGGGGVEAYDIDANGGLLHLGSSPLVGSPLSIALGLVLAE